jgi:hypothetical protein
MDELAKLSELCLRLGAASTEQARVMAAQLMKRADQLALQRGIPREEAMRHLLNVLVHGRAGEVPPAT